VDDEELQKPAKQRVVPIVQDNKNALLLRLPDPTPETTMTTLQHAIARGLEIVFQLEEGEVLTEPVPARDRRHGILLFEATEGGAGVLGRLTSNRHALPRVARKALDLMHFDNIDAAVTAAEPNELKDAPHANCVVGCYRCLLSYYNQPDHELIDRTDRDVQRMLLRLARCQVAAAASRDDIKLNGDWHAALTRWGLPAPDSDPLTVEGTTMPLAWRTRLTAAVFGALDKQAHAAAEALGYSIAIIPEVPGDAPPPQLADLLRQST
jgi:hypothetical protein